MVSGVVVLGSTGSVGRSALAVLAENRERFRLLGLAAGDNIQLLERQIAEFSPSAVSVRGEKAARELRRRFPRLRVLHGPEGLDELVSLPGCDAVLAAINGTEGLRAAVQTLRLKRRLCLANKETLVAAGEIVRAEAATAGAEILPVDSEQSAIFQCLGDVRHVRRVVLTASGGPFFRDPGRDLASVTVAEALAHPTWSMGRKITIDSATMMNKALEIVEARWLFDLAPEQIDVVVHPQSVVHSLVEFVDRSMLAQLGVADMRLPILYSLTHPERIAGSCPSLDLAALGRLEFFAVDRGRFPAVALAYDVLRLGGDAGAVFNTANEAAVERFLEGRIAFSDIAAVTARMLERAGGRRPAGLDDVLAVIAETRERTLAYIDNEVIP